MAEFPDPTSWPQHEEEGKNESNLRQRLVCNGFLQKLDSIYGFDAPRSRRWCFPGYNEWADQFQVLFHSPSYAGPITIASPESEPIDESETI